MVKAGEFEFLMSNQKILPLTATGLFQALSFSVGGYITVVSLYDVYRIAKNIPGASMVYAWYGVIALAVSFVLYGTYGIYLSTRKLTPRSIAYLWSMSCILILCVITAYRVVPDSWMRPQKDPVTPALLLLGAFSAYALVGMLLVKNLCQRDKSPPAQESAKPSKVIASNYQKRIARACLAVVMLIVAVVVLAYKYSSS